MYNDIIALIDTKITTNEYGDTVTNITLREVFAQFCSIRQSEFYQASAQGLKPELMFKISDYYDYNDEQELIYNNKKYKILRTYRAGNELEIVCYGGVNYVSA